MTPTKTTVMIGNVKMIRVFRVGFISIWLSFDYHPKLIN